MSYDDDIINDVIVEESSSAVMGESTSLSSFFWNQTSGDDDDFISQLKPASDVSVDAVKASFFFNAIVFVILIASYEILRRKIPAVYSARRMIREPGHEPPSPRTRQRMVRDASIAHLPEDSMVPLDWIGPVFGVSWARVLKTGGLDGYFFLRYLRMCLRITSITTFWATIILVPVFATGNNGAIGWYHLSMANISNGTWRMWVPTVFIYFFSAFCFFVMKQEYRHFLELRMDFLGKGTRANIDPQHQYSLKVENIPTELRSDTALFEYFDNLFPGKVHSASVVLNIPDLEKAVTRRLRVVRRLEKCIASFHSSNKRPEHVVGRSRFSFFGVVCSPIWVNTLCSGDATTHMIGEDDPIPAKGTRVDSISYYTRELVECNKVVAALQKKKAEIAETGRANTHYTSVWSNVIDAASETAGQIMAESLEDNDLISPTDSLEFSDYEGAHIPQAENMTSLRYGSFGAPDSSPYLAARKVATTMGQSRVGKDLLDDDDSEKETRLMEDQLDTAIESKKKKKYLAPGYKEKQRAFIRRTAGRLGLDFAVAGLRFANRYLDRAVEGLLGNTMSSTGFVTFLDHFSLSCAVSARLTLKPNVLGVTIAPEPRDIRWEAIHTPQRNRDSRESLTNILLLLGVILWSFPLTAIQAFATAEQVALIPGMEWVLSVDGGSLRAFINGYLPVLALLGLILILPVFFGWIAVSYEHRKTLSDVQHSILGRYFYYQLANIYITVTAGSLWKSLAGIVDHPGSVLQLLGQSLPTMVGYFISLLITKILAGLPMVTLRVGALGRMMLLRSALRESGLSQRELDTIYRPYNVMYGWEYPTQLLVIVICFTYAVISPIILPFGAVYFFLALMVYKKQVLYVYTPVYESGGTFFPAACHRTLFGLLCGQLTFLGYTIIRQCYYQPICLFPLPIITIWVMQYFKKHFQIPSTRLSMERAMDCDRISDVRAAMTKGEPTAIDGCAIEERRKRFDKNAYRQPVLTEPIAEPLPYRRGEIDPLTEEAKEILVRRNKYNQMIDPEAITTTMPKMTGLEGISEVPSRASIGEDSGSSRRSIRA